jgi:phage tail sheath gpL-like
MPISFNSIPAALRIPGAFIEFDNSLAGSGQFAHKIIVMGQMLATGTATAKVPVQVSSADQAKTLFGQGSMLAGMFTALLAAERFVEVWGMPLVDVAGNKAAGPCAFTGPATAAGNINLMIGGHRISVAIAKDDADTVIATKVAAAITADKDVPVTAVAAVAVVTVTCRWVGETGNNIDLRVNYYAGEVLPAGVGVTITPMTGGTTNPSITDAISGFGAEWWNWLVNPWTDAANMALLDTELDQRWGPTVQKGARAFTAFAGTHAAATTYGNARNSPHVTCMGTNSSPTPPWEWAAVDAVIGGKSLAIDPARPLQTLVLPGILSPAIDKRWDDVERNIHLFDGIATYTVAQDGKVMIERQITTYQKNAGGLDDDSYLDINTPETLERIRYEQRFMAIQRFPRHKLAGDGDDFPAGQAIVTPKQYKGHLLVLYRSFIQRGWCEDFEGYASTLIVERNGPNKNRMDYRDNPNLVNQLRMVAGQNQFLV